MVPVLTENKWIILNLGTILIHILEVLLQFQ